MKKLLNLFLLHLLTLAAFAQNVYTPKGHLVQVTYVSDDDEFLEETRDSLDNYYSAAYPSATLIETYGGYSSTRKFNCHGYAWHVSEGGDYVWIGSTQYNKDEAVYWQDENQSYILASADYYPGGKVSYGYFGWHDHSAVVANPSTYGSGRVVSKWGSAVLMRHANDDCPNFETDSLRYYKLNPSLTGSTALLCYNSQRTFNTDITNMDDATLVWTPGSYIETVSGAETPAYTIRGLGDGSSYVNFQITTLSGFTWSNRKDFWVGKPVITNKRVDGGTYYSGMAICPGNHYLTVTPVGEGAGTAVWTVPGGIPYMVGTNQLDFTFPSNYNSVSITVTSTNSCGTCGNSSFYLTKKTYGCSKSLSIILYPNPASDYVTLTVPDEQPVVESGDSVLTGINDNRQNLTKPVTYTVNIYNTQSILLLTTKRTGKTFNIPLSGLNDGTYFLKVTDGMNTYTGQLVVKH